MATFHQEGQTIQYQYNAVTINFGDVRTPDDFRQQLKNLQAELNKAIEAKAISDDDTTDVEYQVKRAIQQAENLPKTRKH